MIRRSFARLVRVRLTLIGAVLAGLTVPAGAEPPADKTKDAKSETIVLFDGKTLDGWTKTDFYGAGTVKVEDGAIVLGLGNAMSGITTTRKDLPKTDYEFSYEARRLSGTDFFAAATFPVGDSFITLVNGGWGGNVTGLSSLNGSDASENETNTYIKYKNDTWYKFRARVTRDAIRCWVDDKPIIEVDIRDVEIRTRIEVRENQPLGFATWETSGAVRKIEMRKLTPAEIAANRVAEK